MNWINDLRSSYELYVKSLEFRVKSVESRVKSFKFPLVKWLAGSERGEVERALQGDVRSIDSRTKNKVPTCAGI